MSMDRAMGRRSWFGVIRFMMCGTKFYSSGQSAEAY
jgi:hypothetical protein